MVWRIGDLIHLYLTDVRLSDVKTNQNLLGLFDDLVDVNKRKLLYTIEPLNQEVFGVFNEIVCCNHKYVTTLGQVLDFVKFCAKDRSKYSYSVLASDFSAESLLKLNLADDLLIIIEFED